MILPLFAALGGLAGAAAPAAAAALPAAATAALPAAAGTAAAALPAAATAGMGAAGTAAGMGAGMGAAGALAPTAAEMALGTGAAGAMAPVTEMGLASIPGMGAGAGQTAGALEAGIATGMNAATSTPGAIAGGAVNPGTAGAAINPVTPGLADVGLAGATPGGVAETAAAGGKGFLSSLTDPNTMMMLGGAASMMGGGGGPDEEDEEGDSNYKEYDSWSRDRNSKPGNWSDNKGEFKYFVGGGPVRGGASSGGALMAPGGGPPTGGMGLGSLGRGGPSPRMMGPEPMGGMDPRRMNRMNGPMPRMNGAVEAPPMMPPRNARPTPNKPQRPNPMERNDNGRASAGAGAGDPLGGRRDDPSGRAGGGPPMAGPGADRGRVEKAMKKGGRGQGGGKMGRGPQLNSTMPVRTPRGLSRPMMNYAEGGEVAGDRDAVGAAIEAIEGRSQNPQAAVAQFISQFGPEAFERLVAQVKGGAGQPRAVGGPGDGTSDSVPAQIDGKQPAALSTGEFVVPADVVSGLGNGDTNAGVQALHDMMSRVRSSRTGMTEQPPSVNPKKAMPA